MLGAMEENEMIIRALTAAILLSVSASIAMAESFTFKSTAETTTDVVVAGPTGAPYGGTAQKGTSEVTFASGATSTSAFECVSWMTSGGPTSLSGACNAKDSDADTYALAFSCSFQDEKRETTYCWGMLSGTGGKYAKKTGHMSWSGSQGASTGLGTWVD